jgi:hypothetical protein
MLNSSTIDSMSPSDFCRGFLAKLWTLKIKRFPMSELACVLSLCSVYEQYNAMVNSIKGNEAKSPRYRDLLKIRYMLEPGPMMEFGALRHTMYDTISALRQSYGVSSDELPLNQAIVKDIINQYSADDIRILDLCVNTYMETIKAQK